MTSGSLHDARAAQSRSLSAHATLRSVPASSRPDMLQRPVDSAHIATTDEAGERRLREQAVPKARGFSLRRRTGRWRDALRRRYLAAADIAAVLLAGAVAGISLPAMLATLPV